MALKISVRKQFLAERKNAGNRVTLGFTGIADLRHFIALEYIKGMMKAASDYDINFINMGAAVKYSLFDDIHFLTHYTRNFMFMKPPFVDGLITWAASLSEFVDQKSIVKLFSDLQPLPMVDIGHMDIPGVSMLKIDSASAVKDVMAHLVQKHHCSKFAFFGVSPSEPQMRRLIMYQHELKRHGLPELEGSVFMTKKMDTHHIEEAVNALLARFDLRGGKDIDAIVTASDIIAADLIEHLAKRGISVPGDVAVTGFNNWYDSVQSRSPLTTVDLVYFKRGYAAVEMLIDRIIQPELSPETMYYQPSLVIRQSCGCFEPSVVNSFTGKAVISAMRRGEGESGGVESENMLRQKLVLGVKKIFPFLLDENAGQMIDAFFADVYDSSFCGEEKARGENQPRTLRWFRNVLQDYRKTRDFDSDMFQDAVSELRVLLLPELKNESAAMIFCVENLFHQMRTLISVFQKYEALAVRENPYRLNNLAEQSLIFASATNMEQIFETLRTQLTDLDIPGVVLALSDTMSYSFPVPKIEFAFPEPRPEQQKFMHERVTVPHLFPKEFFDNGKRYSVMLKVLHHSDRYFGYAFFEMKTLNLATYDVIRMLLSNALYVVYKKEGRISNESFSVSDAQVNELLMPVEPDQTRRARISSEKIIAYLTEHIGEMTDVEKMAEALMVSKSFLSKKCKELTGQSVQSLHEKLKIEQAKNMLLQERFELSEISAALGFANQNYFGTVFKKNTGLSPRKWIKQRL